MSETTHAPAAVIASPSAPHLPIRYPTNAVIGILDTTAALEGAVAALNGAGSWASEIEVAAGEMAADAIHTSTGRTGVAGLVVRVAQWLGVQDEEMEYKSHYEHALREGHFVVVVQAPTDGRKARATELLRACGAYSLSFHGRFMIEDLSHA